jgi:hypothetical protein
MSNEVKGLEMTARTEELFEISKLIRKLRWIGLDEQAKEMERRLTLIAPSHRSSVRAIPSSSD